MEPIIVKLRKTIGLAAASIGLGTIERAVHQRIVACKLKSVDAYRQLLHESPDELRALIDALVVPETWFFRDRGAFAAVAAAASEAMARSPRPSAQLRYLCVPCATGEEPLSLAMTLLDAGIPANRFHIDAFDICERLVARGRRGVYGRNSFRGNDTDFRTRYFRDTPEGCAIHPAVGTQVTFRQGNLLDDSTFPTGQIYDAVFCRNLLIYFDAEAQLKALTKISRLLRPDGLLCVAPAETGLLLRYGFVPADVPQAFAFRNEKRAVIAKAQSLAKPPGHHAHARPLALPSPASSRSGGAQGQAQARPPAAPHSQAKEATSPLAAFAEAVRLADEGRFDEVSRICRAHIDVHGASADAYYLLALVSDASARYEDAAALYRKALYLDPQHRDALAHFSLLADKLGETSAAGALRRRALRVEPQDA